MTHYSEYFDAAQTQEKPEGKGKEILPLVQQDLARRAQVGKLKYGETLRAKNGRSGLVDAYQEALDLAMYLRQLIEQDESVKITDV